MRHEIKLEGEYSCLIDTADEGGWNEVTPLFRDATIYQSWAYNRVRSGRGKTSDLILLRSGEVVAAVMLRLVPLPIIKGGMAYVGNGPMWRRVGHADEHEVLQVLAKAIRSEYAQRRGLYLRILPYLYDNHPSHEDLREAFRAGGFECRTREHKTLFLDLEPPLDELRKGLHQKWRNQLNSGERNGLTVRHGTDIGMFRVFRGIYEEMQARKGYPTDVNMDHYESIQTALPETLKPTVVVVELEGQAMAGAVFSTIGDTGIYLLGGTSGEGMTNKASYLVQWHAIRLLKERGFRYYDLGGCSPERVPTTYHFKAGVCGKTPVVYNQIGVMEASGSLVSRLAVGTAERLGALRKRLKARKNEG